MEIISGSPHAFFERNDSETRTGPGGLVLLPAFLAFLACCALTVYVIIERGTIGLWLTPLPVSVLVFAGLILNRMKPGPKKGYATRPDVIVEVDGDKKRVLRLDEIRQIRRVLDSSGFPVFIRLYPKSGDAMTLGELEADRLAGLDRWISSGLPVTVERNDTREKSPVTFLYRYGVFLQIIAFINLPKLICDAFGWRHSGGDLTYFGLAVAFLIIGPGFSVRDRSTPEYDGKLSAAKTLRFVLSRSLAIACLCAYEAGLSIF